MAELFRRFGRDLRGMKHYVIASALVFLAGCALGATDRNLEEFVRANLEALGAFVDELGKSENPKLYMFFFIFFNNAIKSIFFVFFGAVFALFPLFVLVVNGLVLGYLLMHPSQPIPFWELLIKGILPHGIIELPAVILACAYGIRFGGLTLRGLAALFSEERRAVWLRDIMHFLQMTVPLVIVLAVSLFVAAVIESTVTFYLMTN